VSGYAVSMRAAWTVGAVVVVVLVFGCRAHPKLARRIVVAETEEAQACFREAQENFQRCVGTRVRQGVCAGFRDKALMECPGARDASGEPDPTVVDLPGFRP
jgi:hypothetical protein